MAGLVDGHITADDLPESVREFTFEKHLQSGAFGAVWQARTATGKRVAIKVQRKHMSMLTHESAVMQALAPHPHIVEAIHVDSNESGTSAALVTELCDLDLLQGISESRRLDEDTTVALFRQILVAVHHMHSHGFHHCDLKPENVLLCKPQQRPASAGSDTDACGSQQQQHDDGDVKLSQHTVKLADFGATAKGNVFTARNLGSAQYLCPELLTWREGQAVGMDKADVWSLGVVFFTMLAGYQPWSQPTLSDIHFSQFVRGTMRFPSRMSSNAVDFCMAMLALDPRDRPSVAQLLAHPLIGCPPAMVPQPAAATCLEPLTVATTTTPKAAPSSPRASDMSRCSSGESKDSAGSMPSSPLVTPRRAPGSTTQQQGHSTPSAACSNLAKRYQGMTLSCGNDDDDDDDVDEVMCAVSPRPRSCRGSSKHSPQHWTASSSAGSTFVAADVVMA